MRKWAALTAITSMSAAADCGPPEDVVSKFVEAHLENDAGALYQLTSPAVRGNNKGRFVSNYIDDHLTSSGYQEFWIRNFNYEIVRSSERNGVAQVEVESSYPDFMKVVRNLAMEGEFPRLETPSDWDFLHEKMEEEGYSIASWTDTFHLICEDSEWKVLRPRVVKEID